MLSLSTDIVTTPKTYRVRVISGTLRGRFLAYPADKALRPTMQRTKASVFESLGRRVVDCVFVDLFCGAGAIGIEALSRGARHVHFVDRDPRVIDFLSRNLDRCGVPTTSYDIHRTSAEEFVGKGCIASISPDIIYIDPPYGGGDVPVLLEFFDKMSYSGALLVVEHEQDLPLDRYKNLERSRLRKYGQTWVSFVESGEGR